MPKFSVKVHGTGCWLSTEKRRLGRSPKPRQMGFIAARFIEAQSAEDAADGAIGIVEEEVKDLHKANYPWTVTAQEVTEDSDQYDRYAPGSGFIWYPEDDENSTDQ